MRGGVYEQAGAGRFIGADCRKRCALQKAVDRSGGAPAVMGRAYGRIGEARHPMQAAAEHFRMAGDAGGRVDFNAALLRKDKRGSEFGRGAWAKREQHGIIAGDQRVETGWAVPCNARPALDCDADLRQCGDVGIYRGRRQNRAVIANSRSSGHAPASKTVTAWPFMARSNAAVSPASPAPTTATRFAFRLDWGARRMLA